MQKTSLLTFSALVNLSMGYKLNQQADLALAQTLAPWNGLAQVQDMADIIDTGNNTDVIDLSQTLTLDDDLSFYNDYQPTNMAEVLQAEADEMLADTTLY